MTFLLDLLLTEAYICRVEKTFVFADTRKKGQKALEDRAWQDGKSNLLKGARGRLESSG